MGLALGVVLLLLGLVTKSVLGGGGTAFCVSDLCVEDGGSEVLPRADGGVVVLGDLLVGLLGGSVGGLLDLLTDVVGTLLDGIHCDSVYWLVEKVVVGLSLICLKVVSMMRMEKAWEEERARGGLYTSRIEPWKGRPNTCCFLNGRSEPLCYLTY